MNIKTVSGFLISEYLSEIELYYSTEYGDERIKISGGEFYHLIKVMRHSPGDDVWITNGNGEISKCVLIKMDTDHAEMQLLQKFKFKNDSFNYTLCLPHLKNTDRLEFALEKCTELGITRFIIYNSERTFSRAPKRERWEKIVLSAMKQSLRSYLPQIEFHPLDQIIDMKGNKILFDQKAENIFSKSYLNDNEHNYLIIGPEGGLSPKENQSFNNTLLYKLAPNRLRSETAAIACASLLI